MTNKEIFEQNMDELADAINEKAQTYGKKTVTEMTETVRDIHTGAVDSVNGRTGDVVLTKADVELTNVDNTSDADKPISTATQTALDQKQNTLTAGAGVTIENNVISAEVGLKIEVVNELPSVGQNGIIYLVPVASTEEEDAYDQYVYVDGNWESIGNTRVDLSGYVQKTTTIAGISLENNIVGSQLKAALELSKTDVGLGNVDNTADADKPISTATQTALDGKLNAVLPVVKVSSTSSGESEALLYFLDTQYKQRIRATYNSRYSQLSIACGDTALISSVNGISGYSSSVTVGSVNADLTLQTKEGVNIRHHRGITSQYAVVLDGFNTEANPTLAGTEAALTSLKLNDVSYKIPTFDPTAVAGYDASKSQILTHNQGTLTWIDSAATQSGNEVTLP